MNNLNGVSLWFAKMETGELITIDKIRNTYKGKYFCPLCGSEVIPKALISECVTPHFAHIDKEKCSGEGVLHWWVKNELIKENDVIEIITDKNNQVLCKNIYFEKTYQTPTGIYKPDITVETYSNELIFIEVNFSNKKKIDEYLPKWSYLENTVIEFSVKNIYDEEDNKIKITNTFKALYYKGKVFSIDKDSNEYKKYFNGIKSKINIDDLKSVEWFIDDIYKYNIGITDDFESLVDSFNEISKDSSKNDILEDLYRTSKCQKIIKNIVNYKDNYILDIKNHLNKKYGDHIKYIRYRCYGEERLIHDRLFSKYNIEIQMSFSLDSDYISYDIIDFNHIEIFEIEEKIKILKLKYKIRIEFGDLIRELLAIYGFHSDIYYENYYIYFVHQGLRYKIFYDGKININDLSICRLDLNDKEKFIKHFELAMNYSTNKDYMFSENIINLYSNVVERFTRRIRGLYNIKIDNKNICIYKNDTMIGCYEYDKNTKFEQIVDEFSKNLRNYIYNKEI